MTTCGYPVSRVVTITQTVARFVLGPSHAPLRVPCHDHHSCSVLVHTWPRGSEPATKAFTKRERLERTASRAASLSPRPAAMRALPPGRPLAPYTTASGVPGGSPAVPRPPGAQAGRQQRSEAQGGTSG